MNFRLHKINTTSESLGITIPRWIVEKLKLKCNDELSFDLHNEKIIITKEEK